MDTREKRNKFKEISRELITKEYLGIPNMGDDIEYEDELTNAGADYLMSIFINPEELCVKKETLLNVMSRREIEYKSNILKLIL